MRNVYLSRRATRRPWHRTRNALGYIFGVVLVVALLIVAALVGMFGVALMMGL